MNNTSIFGERLLKIREESGETQDQLAEAIGITRQSLSRYEVSDRTPNIEIVYNIATHYKVSVDYLLGLSDIRSTNKNIETVCEITGLSEESINRLLTDYRTNYGYELTLTEVIDKMLANNEFRRILIAISRYRMLTTEYVKSILNNDKHDNIPEIKKDADLEKYRVVDDLKIFFENTFQHPAYKMACKFYEDFYLWQIAEEDGSLYMPLCPPAQLRPMLPPYPDILPQEQVEEFQRNEPTQEEIELYMAKLERYEHNKEIAEKRIHFIRTIYESEEAKKNGKHNAPKE